MAEKTFKSLLEPILSIPIIDTHEHLPPPPGMDQDILAEYLTHYLCRDLVSAGMPKQFLSFIYQKEHPIDEKWKRIEPFWPFVKHTGYAQSVRLSTQALYGLDLDSKTIVELNDRFRAARSREHYTEVLKTRSRIECSILDADLECDREFFRSVYNLNALIQPKSSLQFRHLESIAEFHIHTLDDYILACCHDMNRAYAAGAVGYKVSLAYMRSLEFRRTPYAEAEEGFLRMKNSIQSEWEYELAPPGRAFEDYLMFALMSHAETQQLPVQIHTGFLEGNCAMLMNTHPAHLNTLFLEFPDLHFDIFHIGYPFEQILGALCKNLPNVYIDMCWAHIISPEASIRALVEWLDTVPFNKIMGFGGDYCFIDAVYGHQLIARQNIAKALAIKVDQGALDQPEAIFIARQLLYDNPKRLFKI